MNLCHEAGVQMLTIFGRGYRGVAASFSVVETSPDGSTDVAFLSVAVVDQTRHSLFHERERAGRSALLHLPIDRAPTAWRLVEIDMDKESSMFIDTLNRQKLRKVRQREGRYLLRTNLTENDPALLWQYYIQLVAVEQAFKNLKGDRAIRPAFHRDARRIEAHIFIAFLAYCLRVTLQRRLHALAPGLTARRAPEKFAAVQMIDIHLPATGGRELLLTRYTQPEPELQRLIQQPRFQLPPQPPPKITTAAVARVT